MSIGNKKTVRMSRVISYRPPPGRLERWWAAAQRGDVLLRGGMFRAALERMLGSAAAVLLGLLRVKMSRATHFIGTAELHQKADPPGQRSARPRRANERKRYALA